MTHSVEDIKSESRRLRGSLEQSLADAVTGALREDDQTLIKYHGSYQQDDRDIRDERRRQKLEPAYQFMIRTRTPGGVISPTQWLALDSIATRYANHSLRITTRQAFQFHGVIKRELKATMQAINATLIDTLAACGDVNRNVQVAANPLLSQAHATLYADAARVSEHLLPNTRAYYEIWLDEERVSGSGSEEEPIYGDRYLPRKFKIGFAAPPLNDVDVFANDLGFIAILREGQLLGYNVSIGGGMGASHGDAETWPRVAPMSLGLSPAISCSMSPLRWSPRSATSATAQCASARASSTPSTIMVWTPSWPRSNAAPVSRCSRRSGSPSNTTAIATAGSKAKTGCGI